MLKYNTVNREKYISSNDILKRKPSHNGVLAYSIKHSFYLEKNISKNVHENISLVEGGNKNTLRYLKKYKERIYANLPEPYPLIQRVSNKLVPNNKRGFLNEVIKNEQDFKNENSVHIITHREELNIEDYQEKKQKFLEYLNKVNKNLQSAHKKTHKQSISPLKRIEEIRETLEVEKDQDKFIRKETLKRRLTLNNTNTNYMPESTTKTHNESFNLDSVSTPKKKLSNLKGLFNTNMNTTTKATFLTNLYLQQSTKLNELKGQVTYTEDEESEKEGYEQKCHNPKINKSLNNNNDNKNHSHYMNNNSNRYHRIKDHSMNLNIPYKSNMSLLAKPNNESNKIRLIKPNFIKYSYLDPKKENSQDKEFINKINKFITVKNKERIIRHRLKTKSKVNSIGSLSELLKKKEDVSMSNNSTTVNFGSKNTTKYTFNKHVRKNNKLNSISNIICNDFRLYMDNNELEGEKFTQTGGVVNRFLNIKE